MTLITHQLAAHEGASLKKSHSTGNHCRTFSIIVPTGRFHECPPKIHLYIFLFKSVDCFKWLLSIHMTGTVGLHGKNFFWWKLLLTRCRHRQAPGSMWRKPSCQTAAHHRCHVPYLYHTIGPTGHHQSPSNVHGHVGNVMFSFMKGC